jgi:hypothetical protein
MMGVFAIFAACGDDAFTTDPGSSDASARDAARDGGSVDPVCNVPEGAAASSGPGTPRAGLVCRRHPYPLTSPRDVLVASDGEIYVSEFGAGRIVRVIEDGWDVVAEGLASPIGLRELPAGDLIVAEEGASRVARIDPATGAHMEIAGDLSAVTYLDLGPDGAAYVSSFRVVAPTGTGIVWRVDVGTGAASPYVTEMNVPEGLFFQGGRLVVAEWHSPSAVLRFAAGGGGAGAAEILGVGYDAVYGLVDDGVGGALVGDHAGRIVQLGADGSEQDVLVGIGRPGGMAWTRDRELLIAEFVDFGATGWLIRVSGF